MSSELRWVPLEINPDVMNEWARKAGVSTAEFEFRDIWSLEPEILAVVPQPVKAVILLFPWTAEHRERSAADSARIAEQGQHVISSDVIWIKQTIGNACGSMALLHALGNAGLPVSPGSALDKFFVGCRGKTGTERAVLLEKSQDIAAIHAEMAGLGQTAAPSANARGYPHYTCFVQASSDITGECRLVELDGHRTGPVDRGVCVNLLEDAAKVIKDEYMAKEARYEFGVLALTPVIRD
ncbi:hypothetical protein BC629DRAFT_1511298 [Irpex lacteus]|nr:hypothetical protein BC629DRAFT_1511298 [Irpex lacteus]